MFLQAQFAWPDDKNHTIRLSVVQQLLQLRDAGIGKHEVDLAVARIEVCKSESAIRQRTTYSLTRITKPLSRIVCQSYQGHDIGMRCIPCYKYCIHIVQLWAKPLSGREYIGRIGTLGGFLTVKLRAKKFSTKTDIENKNYRQNGHPVAHS